MLETTLRRALLLILTCLALPSQAQMVGESTGAFLTHPAVEATLLVLGGVFLILSVVTMGSGLAEACCFGTFGLLFTGRYLQGEDPWVPLGLLLVGVVCLLGEVFVLPGFGICGILGMISVAGMTVLVAGSPKVGICLFLLTTMVSVGAGFVAIRLLPSNRFTRRMFVVEPPEAGVTAPTYVPSFLPKLGDRGVASTTLRPGGYAMFEGERVDVVADREFVGKGQAVEVTQVEGSKVMVRSVNDSTEVSPEGGAV